MKINNKSKGFTLIEIIATILIIAIILTIVGTSIINAITKSKNESTKITMNNILSSARIYTKEYSEDISWQKKDGENTKFSCISINELINKNLLKKDIKEKYPNAKYIIIKKDENNNIISEEIDDGTCSNSIKSITIPTSKNFCNNLTYNGSLLHLTESYQNTGFIFNLENDNDLTEKNYTIDVINAGTYTIVAKLEDKNQYQWTDGTTSDKRFSCTIKKATPTITLDSSGINPANITIGENINVKVTSDTNGTLILKSSNNDYYEPSITDNNITAYTTDKEFNIKFLSTRNAEGTITITLIPKDKKNYNNSSTVYTIGTPTKHSIPIPTAETYCENKDYNGNTQNLIKDTASKNGITLANYENTDIGKYTITAKLKYGYIWEDNTTETKTFECEIKRPTFQVCYNSNGSTETTKCDSVLYEEEYTIKENVFSKTGYTLKSWNTKIDGNGQQWEPNSTIKYNYLKNTYLYAQWMNNNYEIYNEKMEFVKYSDTLNNAVDNSNDNYTIKLLKDLEEINTFGHIINKNISIDLNSKILTLNKTMTNQKNLTIKNGTINFNELSTTIKENYIGINNTLNGNMTINNANIYNTNGGNCINNSGNITITSSNIISNNIAIYQRNGTLTIKNGTSFNISTNIHGNAYAIYADGGKTTINNEYIYISGGSAIYNGEKSTLELTSKKTSNNISTVASTTTNTPKLINNNSEIITESIKESTNTCNSFIVSFSDTTITNKGIAQMGDITKTYVLDSDESKYTHTCISSISDSYIINNSGSITYSAGIRSFRGTNGQKTIFNNGDFTLKGGRIYYNDTNSTGFDEEVKIVRIGTWLGSQIQTRALKFTINLPKTNNDYTTTNNNKTYTITYQQYSYLYTYPLT